MPRVPLSKRSFLAWLQTNIKASQSEFSHRAWRAVEGQHVVSTLRLTGNNTEHQDLLEQILEESKPALPPEAKGLHYLLATPFRYAPQPYGSRFRAIADPGVLYAALERRAACAEMGYWRWRFVTDSDGLREIPAAPQTVFQLGVRGSGVDLREKPFSDHAAHWSDPVEYGPTQMLGRVARESGLSLIAYHSVRDPKRGTCLAVLRPAAIRPRRLLAQETWHLTVTDWGTIWQRDRERFVFKFVK